MDRVRFRTKQDQNKGQIGNEVKPFKEDVVDARSGLGAAQTSNLVGGGRVLLLLGEIRVHGLFVCGVCVWFVTLLLKPLATPHKKTVVTHHFQPNNSDDELASNAYCACSGVCVCVFV